MKKRMWKRKTMTLLLALLFALQPLGVLFAQEQVPAEERREEEQVIALPSEENKATDSENTSDAAVEKAKQQEPNVKTEQPLKEGENTVASKEEAEQQEPDGEAEQLSEHTENATVQGANESAEGKTESSELQLLGAGEELPSDTGTEELSALPLEEPLTDGAGLTPIQSGEKGGYTGWKMEGGRWYYYQNGLAYTGWLLWDGSYYYIDNGLMATYFKKIEEKHHYFGANGVWQGVANGWYHNGYYWLYFKEGSLYTGWLQQKAKWYYIQNSYMQRGLALVEALWHNFGEDGVWKGVANGWYSDGETRRYFETGSAYAGWLQQGKKWYYIQNSYMLTGFQPVEELWHDFGADGVWRGVANGWTDNLGEVRYIENGHVCTGWKQINGVWYFFETESGIMVCNCMLEFEGDNYYLSSSGAMHIGWLFYEDNWYYFLPSGKMLKGSHAVWVLGATWYKFAENGILKEQKQLTEGWNSIETDKYYCRNGEALRGWQYIEGSWYHFKENGAMRLGWFVWNNEIYHFANNGKMDTGWVWTAMPYQDHNRYYFKETGAMHVGWLFFSGDWFYLDPYKGSLKGKHKIDGKWHNFDENGVWLGYAE